MCTVYIEVCTRAGNAAAALDMYKDMASASPSSRLAPSVHTYTAAMRAAAAEGGTWHEALTIWDDMIAANCQPTGMLPPFSSPLLDTIHWLMRINNFCMGRCKPPFVGSSMHLEAQKWQALCKANASTEPLCLL